MTTGYKHCSIYNCTSVHLGHRSPFKRSCNGTVTSMNFTSVSLPQPWTRTKAFFSVEERKGDWFLPTFSGIRGNDFRIFFPIMQELWQEEWTEMLGYYQSGRHTDTTSKFFWTRRGWGFKFSWLLPSQSKSSLAGQMEDWVLPLHPGAGRVGSGSPSVTTIRNLGYKPSLEVWWSPNINQNISKSRLMLYRCSVASVCEHTCVRQKETERQRETYREKTVSLKPLTWKKLNSCAEYLTHSARCWGFSSLYFTLSPHLRKERRKYKEETEEILKKR